MNIFDFIEYAHNTQSAIYDSLHKLSAEILAKNLEKYEDNRHENNKCDD